MTDTERLNYVEEVAYVEPASWGYHPAYYKIQFGVKGPSLRETIDILIKKKKGER